MIIQQAVKVMTGCSEEEAELYADLAEQDILRETNRTVVPSFLLSAQIDIAVIRFNMQGTEGETSHSQGGVSVSFESLPEYIQKTVRSQRLAGVGGHAFEKKTNEKVLPKATDI